MAEQAPRLMTLAEFLEWDDGSATHYELIRGRVYAMTSPTEAHGSIVGVIGRLIGNALKPPCRVVHQAAIALPADQSTCYEADLVVNCAPHVRGNRTVEPVLIVEVQSPSTSAHDRFVKLEDYRQISAVQEILDISSEGRRASRYRREAGRWVVEDFVGHAAIELRSISCTIDLAEVYASLDL